MKERKRIVIVLIASLIIAFISGTFAYFTMSVSENETIKGTIANLGLELEVTRVYEHDGLIPLQEELLSEAVTNKCLDKFGYTACQVYKIKLTNSGNIDVEVNGYITLTGDNTVNLKWTELDDAVTYSEAMTRGMERSLLVENDLVEANKFNEYYIMVYLNDIGESQNSLDQGSFGGIVEFNTGEGKISEPIDDSLYNKVISLSYSDDTSSPYVEADTGIDFSKISSETNGQGVYMIADTASNNYPIYYYRGDVKDNNVLFATYCWKIVRTTDTGGIKLIYNGEATDGTCNNAGADSVLDKTSYQFNLNNDDSKYVGYTYDDNIDSNIKQIIDEWFGNSLVDYQQYLEDFGFCNDKNQSEVLDNGLIYYKYRDRLVANKNPSLQCRESDKYIVGNGLLTYPVGLVTADEVAFAGGIAYKSDGSSQNKTFYLYVENLGFWFGTAFAFEPKGLGENKGARVGMLSGLGSMGSDAANSFWGVRPVISLKSGIEILDGDGTAGDPFVVG